MFATGIENSIPTINHGQTRIDEMEVCGHYERWREDFDCVQEIGINFLRYGPPIHKTYLGPNKFDWEFADQTFAELRRRDITPIVDLCHFGVPDWMGNFQNPDFPRLFAAYAGEFAERYPWVQLYTPINEMFICAVFSAKYGWWNEQKKDDKSFVTAIKHLVKANIMGMIEILKRRHDAIFIQSESSEYYHADSPAAIGRDEYEWFLNHRLKQHCIFGNDYYQLNEHRVFADGHTVAAGETFGYAEITRQYYNRYRLPVMHTETNLWEGPHGDEAVKWLWKEWANVLRLRNVGIPTVGFTWYSLTDQVDWDTALREQNGNVNPLGLFDLDRKIRNVGKAYKQLIADWRNVLPASSVCLVVPIKRLSEHDDHDAAGRDLDETALAGQ